MVKGNGQGSGQSSPDMGRLCVMLTAFANMCLRRSVHLVLKAVASSGVLTHCVCVSVCSCACACACECVCARVQVCAQLAAESGVTPDKVLEKIAKLHEVNPMLGLRGCRLGIVHPEISEMQARAIIEAALNVKAKGVTAVADIMVPLVGTVKELEHQVALIRRVANEVFAERRDNVSYRIGTMIEIPRAALLADEVAGMAEFFSFGTNDLTQMTYGYSRDDAGAFLPTYLSQGTLQNDPFKVLDRHGVGKLVKMAVDSGRAVNPKLKIGVCGEHGGEPSSIEFFNSIGLDYVSCSPFRVPIARLGAAQAEVKRVGVEGSAVRGATATAAKAPVVQLATAVPRSTAA